MRQPVISTWESGANGPSTRLLLKYSTLPVNLENAKWLLAKAGVAPQLMDRLADALNNQGRAHLSETYQVRPFPGLQEGPSLTLSPWLVPAKRSIYYIRVSDDFMRPLYRVGDIFIVDSSEADPLKLNEGDAFAIFRPARPPKTQQSYERSVKESNGPGEIERRRDMGESPYEHTGLFVGYIRKWNVAGRAFACIESLRHLRVLISQYCGERAGNDPAEPGARITNAVSAKRAGLREPLLSAALKEIAAGRSARVYRSGILGHSDIALQVTDEPLLLGKVLAHFSAAGETP